MLELVAGASNDLHLRPEQAKMVAGTGVDQNLQSTPVKMVAGGRSNLHLRHKQAKMIAGSNPGPALAWNGDLPAKVMDIIRSLNDTLPHAQLIRAAA